MHAHTNCMSRHGCNLNLVRCCPCAATVEAYEKEAGRLRIMLYYLHKADIAAGRCKCCAWPGWQAPWWLAPMWVAGQGRRRGGRLDHAMLSAAVPPADSVVAMIGRMATQSHGPLMPTVFCALYLYSHSIAHAAVLQLTDGW
jgi:hypothetical protein